MLKITDAIAQLMLYLMYRMYIVNTAIKKLVLVK